ncbi:hypothetical protein I7I48_01562 [Histoplasma ohiense]|nr:hypothetical protein I7I48_01562 [Histoplasma ohiense (nom. inval.)]
MTRAGCCESGKETTDSNCFRAPEELQLYGPLSLSLTRSTLRKSISVICISTNISTSTSTSIRIRTRPIEPRMKQKALKG